MFRISLDYQGPAGIVKRSRVDRQANFRGTTTGLALKYVNTGRERYSWHNQQLDITSGRFLLLPAGANYCATPGTEARTTEGLCVDLHLDLNDHPSLSFLYGGVFESRLWGLHQLSELVNTPGQSTASQLMVLRRETVNFLDMAALVGNRIKEDALHFRTRRELCISLWKANQYLQQNFRHPLRLADLGEIAGLSKYHLARLFKKAFGQTPLAIQTKLRMSAAIKLMREDRHSLTEIALSIGYGDLPTFSRQFRKTYGLSPSQWRKSEAKLPQLGD